MHTPTLVVICGGSGTGKSSLARALQDYLMPDTWLHFSFDTILHCYPQELLALANEKNDWSQIGTTMVKRGAYACVNALLTQGQSVLLECVILSERSARDLVASFETLNPLVVGLVCSWAETERRTLARGDRTLEEARHGHEHALGHVEVDHLIDTTAKRPQLIAQELGAHLREAREPVAWLQNRSRYARIEELHVGDA